MNDGYEKQTFLQIMELVNKLYGYSIGYEQAHRTVDESNTTSKVIPFSDWHTAKTSGQTSPAKKGVIYGRRKKEILA